MNLLSASSPPSSAGERAQREDRRCPAWVSPPRDGGTGGVQSPHFWGPEPAGGTLQVESIVPWGLPHRLDISNLKAVYYSLHLPFQLEFCAFPNHCLTFFKINLFILFIYYWLCWVFVAARRLSLVVASGGYSSLWCTGFSLRWLLLLRSARGL